jgi:hypothetical protein
MIVYSILFENINVQLQMKKDVRESFAQPGSLGTEEKLILFNEI